MKGIPKLLNIDANAKTVKGQKRGFLTAILYLAPYKVAGINVCPMAELAGCWQGCLNTAGRGGIAKDRKTMQTPAGLLPDNAIQRCRIKRTRFYADDREGFMAQLHKEIAAFVAKAARKGLTPAVRLNGTSDIQWERGHPVAGSPSIFAAFSSVQFYDYTKLPARFTRMLPANYHLSLSHSGASLDYKRKALRAHAAGAPLVVVARNAAVKSRMMASSAMPTVDGDKNDLRFLDPDNARVILKAKGKARQDASGFVFD